MLDDLRRLYQIFTPEDRRRLPAVIFVMLAAAALQAASVASIYPFLSQLTGSASLQSGWIGRLYAMLGSPTREAFLAYLGLGVLLLVVLANGALALADWLRLRFQWGFNHRLSMRLMDGYLNRAYPFYLEENSSELQRNVITEAPQFTNNTLGPALTVVSKASVAFAMALLLIFVNPLATALVVAIIGGGYGLAYLFIRRKLQVLGEEYQEANRERYQTTSEAFGGIKEIKLFGCESYYSERFRPASEQHARSLSSKAVFAAIPKYSIEALAIGGFLAVLVLFLLTGQSVSTIVPLMGTFVFAGYRMLPAFRGVLSAASGFRFNDSILPNLEKALGGGEVSAGGSEAAFDSRSSTEPLLFEEDVQLTDVTYTYPNAREPAIKGVDISIPKDESIALVGETGAGKTTLVDILLGLLEPDEGELRIDGKSITGRDKDRWQAAIGYVPQDIYLADVSIRENIALGIPEDEIDDDKVQRAARVAHIDQFVENQLPNAYDTVVGERGVRLSGGQRQRLGIARALYNDPPVVVFDEATSDIDGVTEANITQAIKEFQGDKTMVTIAHRLSTIRSCDRIYLVENGRIAGSGDYEALMDESPRFRAMAEGRAEADLNASLSS